MKSLILLVALMAVMSITEAASNLAYRKKGVKTSEVNPAKASTHPNPSSMKLRKVKSWYWKGGKKVYTYYYEDDGSSYCNTMCQLRRDA